MAASNMQMKALVKNGSSLSVTETEKPAVAQDHDVIIRIALSGICRTDVFAAEGRVKTIDRVVLGHEFSGIVDGLGDAAQQCFKTGDRVTVMPIMPCGTCALCLQSRSDLCQQTTMLGIDRDGSFGAFVRVPTSAVYAMPETMSFRYGAYAEPVAAALSVMDAGLTPDQKGVIYGDNRFGHLIQRIMRAKGFNNISIYDPSYGFRMDDNRFDFAIETMATTDTMSALMKAVRPQGKIVIKSRKHEAIGIHFADAVRKQITFQAVNYGSFTETIDLLASGVLQVDDLLGDVRPLDSYADVFARSKTHEERKTFFGLMDRDVWDC